MLGSGLGLGWPCSSAIGQIGQGASAAALTARRGDKTVLRHPGRRQDQPAHARRWRSSSGCRLPTPTARWAISATSGYGGAGAGSTWGPNSATSVVWPSSTRSANVDVNGQHEELTKGYALTAVLLKHYWTPTIRSGRVSASYSELEATAVASSSAPLRLQQLDGPEGVHRIGSPTSIWSPVSGLDIGVEVLYAKAAAASRPVIAVDCFGNRSVATAS